MTPDDLAVMVDKVIASPLPDPYRQAAQRLLAYLPDQPIRVSKALKVLANEYATRAHYDEPSTDLFKCVPARTVHRHMTIASWRTVDERAFLAAADSSGDPAEFIRRAIPSGMQIFPRARSWLIEAPAVLGMTSRELKAALELRDDQHPPFVVFRLTPARMKVAGVAIRVPNALDAAAAEQPQWNPWGLSLGREYLDKAVHIEAVEDLVWKP